MNLIITIEQKNQLMADVKTLVNDNTMAELFVYLLWRWKDEREYENISDYAKAFAKVIPSTWEVIGANKRPFGFRLKHVSTETRFNLFVTPRDTFQVKVVSGDVVKVKA